MNILQTQTALKLQGKHKQICVRSRIRLAIAFPLFFDWVYLFHKFGKVQLFLSHFDIPGKEKEDSAMSSPNFSERFSFWCVIQSYVYHTFEHKVKIRSIFSHLLIYSSEKSTMESSKS